MSELEEKLARELYEQDWPLPWSSVKEELKKPYYAKANHLIQSLNLVQLPEGETPKVICLCGSTRFSEAFAQAQMEQTLAGNIVLTIGCNLKSDSELFLDKTEAEIKDIKTMLDELHLCKIDMANEVLILNVGGLHRRKHIKRN